MSRFVINTGVYTIMPFMLYYLINVYSLTRDEAFGRQIQIAMLVNLTGLIATWPAGIASDRFSKKRVIYFTCAICIAGGLGFAFSGSIIAAIVAAGIFGFGYGAFMAVDMALVCNVLPKARPPNTWESGALPTRYRRSSHPSSEAPSQPGLSRLTTVQRSVTAP
jgi:MFS family permease